MVTDQQHPITPSLELVEQLRNDAPYGIRDAGVTRERHLVFAAYRAGADAELEACCEWLDNTCCDNWDEIAAELRAAMRPKPPSVAEQAIAKLDIAVIRGDCITTSDALPSLRAALKRLQELEQDNG